LYFFIGNECFRIPIKFRRCQLALLLVIFAFFLLSPSIELVGYAFRRRASISVQLLDLIGIPSTVYMPDVSCSHCNNFDTRYLLDVPSGDSIHCTADHKIFLLVLVASGVQNFNRRKIVRQTWGSVSEYKSRSVRTFFICGRTNSSSVKAKLAEEAAYWGDIVQVDYYFAVVQVLLSTCNRGKCGLFFIKIVSGHGNHG
jgi:Galactosyltransferase